MRCYIVRPFDPLTVFWTYKVKINEQEFLLKKTGTRAIDVEPSSTYEIDVFTPSEIYRFSSPTITKNSADIIEGSQIVVRCRLSNWPLVITSLVGLLLLIFAGFVLNNVLLAGVIMFLSLSLDDYFLFGYMKRKTFFKITILNKKRR
jgi:hypothetical protein